MEEEVLKTNKWKMFEYTNYEISNIICYVMLILNFISYRHFILKIYCFNNIFQNMKNLIYYSDILGAQFGIPDHRHSKTGGQPNQANMLAQL